MSRYGHSIVQGAVHTTLDMDYSMLGGATPAAPLLVNRHGVAAELIKNMIAETRQRTSKDMVERFHHGE